MTAGAQPQTTTRSIYEHDAHALILPCLAAHLPHSISLVRRIQHGVHHPTPTARVLATFPPGARPPDDAPWLAARVDLFRGRETQMIVYSSLEKGHTSNKPVKIVDTIPGTDGTEDNNSSPSYVVSTFDAPQPVLDTVRDQLVSLLVYIKINLLPTYLASLSAEPEPEPEPELPTEKTSHNGSTTANSKPTSAIKAVTLIPAPPPKAFLLGTLHTALFSLLQQTGSEVFAASRNALDGSSATPVPGLRVHRFDDPPYYKFFFQRAAFTQDTDSALPAGYRFHNREGQTGVLDSQLDLVQSRTHIPRSRAQLRLMPGSAIYVDSQQDVAEEGDGEEMPIAWAFLGLDGALSTLHVEEAHRGKGLALALSKETMRRGLVADSVFGASALDVQGDEKLVGDIEGWVHTEVAQYNVASRRVMEKIGGEALSTVMWAVIEVCD
ncbi:Acyl-CoA N-acyltransferase [Penicillium cosmopolitanum]|uniref:Acyl-CoA N-acyltransferase n=1 Tax=Penicillium cosmopolitanum TaxID=1131564 RepID=A0A9W9W0N5_9EURO|nr:Acyl-CoA N-acyltransferase [Penicillium cosmopolitanum]KAJ5396489.1 Acyl-CoA N-acyltransferase [Penicillium cosmopolitanum]